MTLVVGGLNFDTKDIGSGKTVTGSGLSLVGADAANYTLSTTIFTTTADITARTLTPTVAASDKLYDVNNTASLSVHSLATVIGSEVVNLNIGSSTFSSKTVGNNKTVAVTGMWINGPDAANYVLASTALSTTASITAKQLTASIMANDKQYDGSTTASNPYANPSNTWSTSPRIGQPAPERTGPRTILPGTPCSRSPNFSSWSRKGTRMATSTRANSS